MTLTFWFIAWAMTLLVLGLLLWPLLKRQESSKKGEGEKALSVYRQQFAANGMTITGTSPDGKLVEVIELTDHPWFLAVQCHPEFKSKPTRPHPLFSAFVSAAYQHKTAHVPRTAESVA